MHFKSANNGWLHVSKSMECIQNLNIESHMPRNSGHFAFRTTTTPSHQQTHFRWL